MSDLTTTEALGKPETPDRPWFDPTGLPLGGGVIGPWESGGRKSGPGTLFCLVRSGGGIHMWPTGKPGVMLAYPTKEAADRALLRLVFDDGWRQERLSWDGEAYYLWSEPLVENAEADSSTLVRKFTYEQYCEIMGGQAVVEEKVRGLSTAEAVEEKRSPNPGDPDWIAYCKPALWTTTCIHCGGEVGSSEPCPYHVAMAERATFWAAWTPSEDWSPLTGQEVGAIISMASAKMGHQRGENRTNAEKALTAAARICRSMAKRHPMSEGYREPIEVGSVMVWAILVCADWRYRGLLREWFKRLAAS